MVLLQGQHPIRAPAKGGSFDSGDFERFPIGAFLSADVSAYDNCVFSGGYGQCSAGGGFQPLREVEEEILQRRREIQVIQNPVAIPDGSCHVHRPAVESALEFPNGDLFWIERQTHGQTIGYYAVVPKA